MLFSCYITEEQFLKKGPTNRNSCNSADLSVTEKARFISSACSEISLYTNRIVLLDESSLRLVANQERAKRS